MSCVGHVRELPSSAKRIPASYKAHKWSRLGVDVENGFRPIYVLIAGKQKVMTQLRRALAEADELILATDEDREGEAISWHLVELLKPKVPVRRAVFHEITPEAIKAGISAGRDIDANVVAAQETRRILDRLAGYKMSPLLWKKISRGLSAGRVQSVALNVIVQRDLERLRFKSALYCDAVAEFSVGGEVLSTALVAVDSKRVARGADFDGETGALTAAAATKRVAVLSGDDVAGVMDGLGEATVAEVLKTRVRKVGTVPFITSTLQQEGGNKLGMSAARVMRVAQKLYENGHITYMRTDNPELSEQAVAATRAAVEERYGAEYLWDSEKGNGKRAEVKKPKGAQAAHEAIRPAGSDFTSPEVVRLDDPDEMRVYSLIYRQTLASQMASAAYDTTSISIDVSVNSSSVKAETALFRATGRVVVFPGFLRAYEALDASGSASLSSVPTTLQDLPDLKKGTVLNFESGEAVEHETKPRARFTDASLVKELEALGVGRPSTYSAIIEKLVNRGYVFRGNMFDIPKAGVGPRALVPSLNAFAVDKLLSTHFPEFIDAGFTAKMEKSLDTIAAGRADSVSYLSEYYLGEDGLESTVEKREIDIDDYAFRKIILPNYPPQDGEEGASAKAEKTSGKAVEGNGKGVEVGTSWRNVNLLVGPHGPYLERDGNSIAPVPRTILADELSADFVQELIDIAKDPVLGEEPVTGVPILIKSSKYGPYVQYGRDDDAEEGQKPRRQGLLKGMDAGSITIEMALQLLSLPRLLGRHPASGEEVRAGTGRFGPYVTMVEKDTVRNASLNEKTGSSVFDVGLSEAVELLDAMAERRKKREEAAAAKATVKAEAGAKSSSKSKVQQKIPKAAAKRSTAAKKTSAGAKKTTTVAKKTTAVAKKTAAVAKKTVPSSKKKTAPVEKKKTAPLTKKKAVTSAAAY